MRNKIRCKKCGFIYEKGAKCCPNCYKNAPLSFKEIIYLIIAIVVGIALLVGAVLMFLDDGVDDELSSSDVKTPSSSNITEIGNSSVVENNNSSSIINTSSNIDNSGYKQPTDSDGNVIVKSDGIVNITIPKWFLLLIEPNYDYKLTDKEANMYNFKSVSKNNDGSATYTVSYNDYHKFLLTAKSAVNAVVYEYSNNTWFSKIEADEGYNNIKIYTKYDSLDSFDDGFGIYIVASGTQATFYQYMHYDYSVGTTITVYNKDNKLLATYEFPEFIK